MENLFAEQDTIEQLLNDVATIAQALWERGWSERNAGNISLLLPDVLKDTRLSEETPLEKPFPNLEGKCFYMTGTGKRMHDIARSPLNNGLLVQIGESGKCFRAYKQNPAVKPTSELSSHLGIHNMISGRGTDETVVLHTHATEVIALTQYSKIKSSDDVTRIVWGMHPETMIFIPKGVGLVPYMLPGTEAIALATIESFKNHDIVVWKKHGIFAIGKNIVETFDNVDIVCKSAKIWFQCKSAGFEPEGMTDAQLDELRELVKKFNA